MKNLNYILRVLGVFILPGFTGFSITWAIEGHIHWLIPVLLLVFIVLSIVFRYRWLIPRIRAAEQHVQGEGFASEPGALEADQGQGESISER